MTLQEIMSRYTDAREGARRFDSWHELDRLVEELAQLAAVNTSRDYEQEQAGHATAS